jgi:short-subunit dehydrogenase
MLAPASQVQRLSHWLGGFAHAGRFFPVGPFMDLSMEALKSAFEINVFSVFRVTHAVVPYMAKRKSGLIINMGSLAGFV